MKQVRILSSVFLALALLFLALGVAYAYVITVDGNGGDWLPASKVTTDDNESGISDTWDFGDIYFTTDNTYMYWRFDSYANTDWSNVGNRTRVVQICMNTDNNLGTGGTIGNCNNMQGVDRILEIYGPKSGNNLNVALYDGSWNPLSPTNAAAANQTSVNEARVQLSDLGINSNCSSSYNMPWAMYWDNQVTDPDDNVPNTGTLTVQINCPTAVTFSSLTAQPVAPNVPVLPFAMAGLLGAGALGLFVVQRRTR